MQPKSIVVDVWLADAAGLALPNNAPLSAGEHDVLKQRHNAGAFQSAHTFAVSRAMRRALLSARAGGDPSSWCFATTSQGQPYLSAGPDIGLATSLSHTGTWVACAVARASHLGVDIEPLQRLDHAPHRAQALAQRFFSQQESAAQAKLADDVAQAQAFMRRWTQKEAALKAWGAGLGAGLKDVTLVPDGPKSCSPTSDSPGATLVRHRVSHKGFEAQLLCLAVSLQAHLQAQHNTEAAAAGARAWPSLSLCVAVGQGLAMPPGEVAINIYRPCSKHIDHCLHPPLEATLHL